MKQYLLPCLCSTEILSIENIDNDEYDIAIYYRNLNNKMTLWQRIKYCIYVLKNGSPYKDQICVRKSNLEEFMKNILNDMENNKYKYLSEDKINELFKKGQKNIYDD